MSSVGPSRQIPLNVFFPMATTNGEKVTFRVGYIPVSGGILWTQKKRRERIPIHWQTTYPFFGRTTIMFDGTPD